MNDRTRVAHLEKIQHCSLDLSMELPNRFLQRESDLDRHLPVLNASFFDVATRFYDFEPAEIIEAVPGTVNGILNGILDRLRG